MKNGEGSMQEPRDAAVAPDGKLSPLAPEMVLDNSTGFVVRIRWLRLC
jgi:hypothetical protein